LASNTTRIVLKNRLNCREYIRAQSIRTKFFFLECWDCCRVEREFHAFIFRVLLYGVYILNFDMGPKISLNSSDLLEKSGDNNKNNPIGKSARDARQRLAAFERRSELLR
jgi:hypothetical protein